MLGVVYAFAYPTTTATCLPGPKDAAPLTRNGKAVCVTWPTRPHGRRRCAGDRLHLTGCGQDPAANAACVAPARFIAMPSIAYRLALVAAGEGVAAVSLNGPGDWDYAGGHALLHGPAEY